MENNNPIPAINIGRMIGDIPPKLSFETVSCPSTMVAKTVAT